MSAVHPSGPHPIGWGEIATSFVLSIVVVAAWFHPITLGGKTIASAPHVPFTLPEGPVGYDRFANRPAPLFDPYGPGWIHEANLDYRRRAFAAGEVPLWQPHEACGNPYFAGLLPGLLCPIHLPMVLLPAPIGLDVSYLLKLVLAVWLTFLLLRFVGCGRAGSTAGAVLFGGSGYLATGVNLSNASVECLVPGVLLAVHAICVRGRTRDVLLGAVIVFLVLVGGNPEASFLALAFGGLYAAWRIGAGVVDTRIRASSRLVFAALAGALAAAPQLLPFLEFVGMAEHTHHTAGAVPAFSWRLLVPMFVPGFFREAYAGAELGAIGGLYGLATCAWLFAIVACSRGGPVGLKRFAAVTCVLAYAWYVGVAGSERVTTLPVLNQINLQKYALPYLCFLPAVLGGIGLDRLVAMRAWVARGWIVVAVIIVACCAGVYVRAWKTGGLAPIASKHLLVGPNDPFRPYLTVLVLVLLAVVVLTWLRRSRPRVALGLLVALAFGETLAHLPRTFPARRAIDRAPPFVAALHGERRNYRVYSPDPVLFPNTASMFGLNDVRYAEALKIGRYVRFVERAFAHPGAFDYFPIFPHELGMPIRALSLCGVRYVLRSSDALAPRMPRYGRRDVTLRPGPGEALTVECKIEPDGRAALWERGFSAGDVLATARVDADGAARPVELRAGETHAAGAGSVGTTDAHSLFYLGVTSFPGTRVELSDATWAGEPLSFEAIRSGAYRRGTAALGRYRGRTVLRRDNVVALPTPRPGAAAVFAARVRVHGRGRATIGLAAEQGRMRPLIETPDTRIVQGAFSIEGATTLSIALDGARLTRFHLVPAGVREVFADERVVVFENPAALPRAFGVYAAEVIEDDAKMLDRLLDPTFSYRTSVLLEAGDAVPRDEGPDDERSGAVVDPAEPIVRWREEAPGGATVELDATFARPGWLVLLDNHYPGWQATVDDEPVEIRRANFTFRAVRVPAGTHRVRFTYRPTHWNWSVFLAALALVPLALGIRLWSRPSRKP